MKHPLAGLDQYTRVTLSAISWSQNGQMLSWGVNVTYKYAMSPGCEDILPVSYDSVISTIESIPIRQQLYAELGLSVRKESTHLGLTTRPRLLFSNI